MIIRRLSTNGYYKTILFKMNIKKIIINLNAFNNANSFSKKRVNLLILFFILIIFFFAAAETRINLCFHRYTHAAEKSCSNNDDLKSAINKIIIKNKRGAKMGPELSKIFKDYRHLDSHEIELSIFEILFLCQKHNEYEFFFNAFVKKIENINNNNDKNFYSQIALLYQAFVNHAMNEDRIKPLKSLKINKTKLTIFNLLGEKYAAAYASSREEAAKRKNSPDFISYLEKKCNDTIINDNHNYDSPDTAHKEKIYDAIKEFMSNSENLRLLQKRYLLMLMIYKNIKLSNDDFNRKLIIQLIKKSFPDELLKKTASGNLND